MNILIRCDSSNIIGTGHVMRCLNLCEYYPKHNFTFICRNFSNNISNKIKLAGHNLILLDYNIEPELKLYKTWTGSKYKSEVSDIINILKTDNSNNYNNSNNSNNPISSNNKYDIVIIDHYGIDYKVEFKIRDYCNKVVVITDIFNTLHYCDIFLNYNCDNLEIIKHININKNTNYKIGSSNIIINKLFLNISSQKTEYNENIKTITINMGGSDPNNYTLQVLEYIFEFILQNNIIVKIVIGKANININSIKHFLENTICNTICNNQFIIYYDINFENLIKLYKESDLAIGSLSITAYERLYLQIPQICIKIVENQLIQELELFNIVMVNNIMDKINNYKNIINNITGNIGENITEHKIQNNQSILESINLNFLDIY